MNPNIPFNFHGSWHEYIEDMFAADGLVSKIKEEVSKSPFTPKPIQIFKAFNMKISDVKIVMIGQDPYPNGQGNGIAFAVNPGVEKTYSLRMLEQSLQDYKGNPAYELDGTLYNWSRNGILLLNTALTMKLGEKKSHVKLWHEFMKRILGAIVTHNTGVIIVPLGNTAKDLVMKTVVDYPIMKKNSWLVTHSHPAAEKHNRGIFLKSGSDNLFAKIDEKYEHIYGKKFIW